MHYIWLEPDNLHFPQPQHADADGIIALGGDLSVERLLVAYTNGIFPWYNKGNPIIWWNPDPRFVLFPDKLKVAKSMRPYFNQKKYQVTFNQQFDQVIRSCGKTPRKGQNGTWITDDMIAAYTQLHKLGWVHSVEVWDKEQLVGGLYGLWIGDVFFGESMFSLAPNASKFGFISWVRLLQQKGVKLIDCQQETKHLASLGAESISRAQFLNLLKQHT